MNLRSINLFHCLRWYTLRINLFICRCIYYVTLKHNNQFITEISLAEYDLSCFVVVDFGVLGDLLDLNLGKLANDFTLTETIKLYGFSFDNLHLMMLLNMMIYTLSPRILVKLSRPSETHITSVSARHDAPLVELTYNAYSLNVNQRQYPKLSLGPIIRIYLPPFITITDPYLIT